MILLVVWPWNRLEKLIMDTEVDDLFSAIPVTVLKLRHQRLVYRIRTSTMVQQWPQKGSLQVLSKCPQYSTTEQ